MLTPRVEFRDLHWAIVAAQYRSLRQAAIILNIRQSTLSRGLRDLEYRLGVPLFERTNGGTRPTLAGQEFLDAARHIVDDTELIIGNLKIRSRGESGRLMVGIHASLSTGNLRATLMEFRHRFPKVETFLVDGSSNYLLSGVANSAIDIAFVSEGSPKWDGKSLPVWSERVVLAIPNAHPLARRDIIRWSDLRDEAMLIPSRGPGPEFLKLLVRKIGYSESCRIIRHDIQLDRFLTLVGAGWGLMLALEGATGAIYPGVTFREVHDTERPARLGFHAYWHQTNGNPSLHPFLDILRERYPDLSADAAPD